MPSAQLDDTKTFNYGSKELNRVTCLEKQCVLDCDQHCTVTHQLGLHTVYIPICLKNARQIIL